MKKKLIIYGVGTFFSKILVFLMVPIYTRMFSTSDYGYYDVVVSDLQMLVSISYIEIWSGILRFMYSEEKKETPIRCYLTLFPFMLLVYAFLLYLLSRYIYIKYPVEIFLYGISYLLYTIGNTICRGYEKNFDYVLSGLIYTILSCALSIIFSTYCGYGIRGLIEAQCIGYLAAAVYVEIKTSAYKNALRIKTSIIKIKDILQYSIPLMLNSFSFLFLGTYNKNIILKQLGENESGLYAFVLKFSAIFSILISIYSLAWQEQAFSVAEKKNKEQIYEYYVNKFLKIVGLAVPCFVFVVYIAAPIIGGENYYASNRYIALAVSAAYISEISGVFSVIIAVNKKTFETFISTFIGSLINVILANILIQMFGVNGSSVALNSGFFVAAILRYLFVKKDMALKINLYYVLFYFLELGIFVMISEFFEKKILLLYALIVILIWFMLIIKDLKSIWTEFIINNKEKKNEKN